MSRWNFMKNGQQIPLTVKVEDTLPVGTEVDYDGQDIPEGWVEVTDRLVEKRLVEVSLASGSATNITSCSITAPRNGLAIVKVTASFSGGGSGIRYVNIYGENGQLQAIANSQVANQNGSTSISGIEFVNVKEGATYMPRLEQTSGGALTVYCSIQMLYI